MESSGEKVPKSGYRTTSWDIAKSLFHEKVKEEEGGDLTKVQQFLCDSTTVGQALESCESARKKADNEYSTGYVTVGGKDLFLRKRLKRILKKVQMFVQFGDIAIQHNPDTTALVWAAFRMMLQVAINDIEICELLTDACEEIAGTLFICEVYERRYRVVAADDRNNVEVAHKVVEQIPPLYATILELSYDTKKFLDHQKIARFLRSNTGLKFKNLISSIKKKVQEIHATAGVAFQEEALASLTGLHKEFKDEFDDLRQFLQDSIFSITEDTNKNVQEIRSSLKEQSKLDVQKMLEVECEKNVKWLEPLDNLEGLGSEYRLNLDRRQPNTCTWIFNCAEYKNLYQSDSSRMLWILGNAGFGKSVLVSTIIERLKEENDRQTVLFFFCKTGDDSTQRAASVLRNLIFQAYEKARESSPELHAQCTKIITKAQSSKTKRGEMTEYVKSIKNLKQILEEIIEASGKQVFIVIDALDECKDRKLEGLLAALQELAAENNSIRIIFASRPEVDIYESLEGIPRVEVNQSNNSADIKAYLVKELKGLSSLTAKDRKIACKAIIERSDGMFRYANMQIDRLRQPWRPPLKNHLEDLPVGIEASYRQLFEQIKPELQDLLIVALRWTILADGDIPALLVAEDYRRVFESDEESDKDDDSEDNETDEDYEDDKKDGAKSHDEMLKDTLMHIKEAGSVFLESKGNETTISLRHTSVKDFVLREGERAFSLAEHQQILCERCKTRYCQVSALAITPKSGHLALCLSILNHLNSTAFIERYLPMGLENPEDKVHTSSQQLDNPDDAKKDEGTLGEPTDLGGLEDKVPTNPQEPDNPDNLDNVEKNEDTWSEPDSDYNIQYEWHTADANTTETRPRYELTHWMYHLREAEHLWSPEEREQSEDWTRLWELLDRFLFDNAAAFIRWQHVAWIDVADYPYDLPDSNDSVGEPLHVAASYGLTALAERLLKKGVDINSVNQDGVTALHLAAGTQEPKMVELLLNHGADVNIRDRFMATPLLEVSYRLNGNAEIAKYLLDKGANPVTPSRSGATPLHFACFNGNSEIFKLLVAHGASITAKDNLGETPLHYALDQTDPHLEIIKELIRLGADVNEQNNESKAPLYAAVFSNTIEAINILLDSGADINDDDVFGYTALHAAATNEYLEALALLVERGANINVQDKKGKTPLSWAAQMGKAEAVRFLLQKHAAQGDENSGITTADIRGRTVLHRAAAKGHLETVAIILEAEGADSALKAQDNTLQATPLHTAAYQGHEKIVDILLKHGSDINAKNRAGSTPFDLALEIWSLPTDTFEGNGNCLIRMIKDVQEVSAERRNLLHIAVEKGSESIVKQLLELGVDPNGVDERGRTAMLYCDKPTIANILKSHGETSLNPSNDNGGDSDHRTGNSPTCVVDVEKSTWIAVSEYGMCVQSTGIRDKWHERGQARANYPIPPGKYIFYYEIEVSGGGFSQGSSGIAGLGICREDVTLEGRFPGWDKGSFGYHGDDGKFFSEEYIDGMDYGETYGVGDIIGCGVDLRNNTLFFTKNGKWQGIAANNVQGIYYPVVGIFNNLSMRVNFGQDKEKLFRYKPTDSPEIAKYLETTTEVEANKA